MLDRKEADIYEELYVLNKNANAMSRVLERLRLVGTYSKPQLEALQRRLEGLCAELNVQILEDPSCARTARLFAYSQIASNH